MATKLSTVTPVDKETIAKLYDEATQVLEREQGTDENRNLSSKYVLILDMQNVSQSILTSPGPTW